MTSGAGKTCKASPAKIRRRIFAVAGAALIIFAGTAHAQYSDFGKRSGGGQTSEEAQPAEAAPVDFSQMRAAPRAPRIGRIAWVDQTGTRAVVWLDRNFYFNERPLASRDKALRPQALLRMTKERTGRALGVVVESGKIILNQEVVLPGEEMIKSFKKPEPAPAPEKPAAETKTENASAKPA